MTIYALSTGSGISGIAVIRVSGKEASLVIKSLTKLNLKLSRLSLNQKNILITQFLRSQKINF